MGATGGAVDVAIALVRRADRFLIRRRPPAPGSPMPGRWEFPGGKVEPGESTAEAARREVREEAGLDVAVLALRRVIEHRYPHGFVRLHYHDAEPADPDDAPDPNSGFAWVDAPDLPGLDFPEANGPILRELAAAPADRRESRDDRPRRAPIASADPSPPGATRCPAPSESS